MTVLSLKEVRIKRDRSGKPFFTCAATREYVMQFNNLEDLKMQRMLERRPGSDADSAYDEETDHLIDIWEVIRLRSKEQ